MATASKRTTVSDPAVEAITTSVQQKLRQMIDRLRDLVEIESPSDDKAAVDRAGTLVANWCRELGAEIKIHPSKTHGNHLEVRFNCSNKVEKGSKRLLILGHLDTVWSLGTLNTMPWREDKKAGKLYGPGVYDMKSGILMAITAIAVLKELKTLQIPVILLLVSDEEIGSPTSRKLTETIAKKCTYAFVMEPSQGPHGAYKTARKGVGDYRIEIKGVASHSGVDFEKGHSAILELTRILAQVEQFTDLSRGITINPGLIGGGTRSNVIAAEAWAEVDVRIAQASDIKRVKKLFRSLKCINKHCTLKITGGLNRPPMERKSGTIKLFQQARQLAEKMGFRLEEASTGGGSDGNFTASVGTPTLDGMGPIGEGAHAANESLLIESLVQRTALLAAIIASC